MKPEREQPWKRAYDLLRDPRFAAFLIGHGVRDPRTLTMGQLARLMTDYRTGDRSQ